MTDQPPPHDTLTDYVAAAHDDPVADALRLLREASRAPLSAEPGGRYGN